MGFRYDLEPVKKDEAKEKTVMQEDKSWLEDEYEWPDEIFDKDGMLLPGHPQIEIERNRRIREAVWHMLVQCNINDKEIMCRTTNMLRAFLAGRR